MSDNLHAAIRETVIGWEDFGGDIERMLVRRLEGYVKMPSREALAEALFQVYDHGTSPNAFREADAILALLAGKTS